MDVYWDLLKLVESYLIVKRHQGEEYRKLIHCLSKVKNVEKLCKPDLDNWE